MRPAAAASALEEEAPARAGAIFSAQAIFSAHVSAARRRILSAHLLRTCLRLRPRVGLVGDELRRRGRGGLREPVAYHRILEEGTLVDDHGAGRRDERRQVAQVDCGRHHLARGFVGARPSGGAGIMRWRKVW